jgi:preprotein translocase subunit SecD
MFRRNLIIFTVITIIFILAVLIVLPVERGIIGAKELRLGLDLVGGSNLVYQVQFPEGVDEERALARALETIRTRIDKYGVTEPVIQSQEGKRIQVQLPGFTDIEEAKQLVEQTGFLEFRQVEVTEEGNPVLLGNYLDMEELRFINDDEIGERIFVGGEVDGKYNPIAFLVKTSEGGLAFMNETGEPLDIEVVKQIEEELRGQPELGFPTLYSWIAARGENGTHLTGDFLEEATPNVVTQPTGAEAQVDIVWNEEGGEIFDQIANNLYNSGSYGSPQRALGIFLDKVLLSFPQILEPAYGGRGSITGNFSIAEVERLANLLESGALPMPLQKPPIFEEVISATLGAGFIDTSFMAGMIGIILVILFMSIYYRLPGIIASLALVFYGAVVLAIFKLIPVTLTLAGIGGFVLSIGMAVDANVLIFERMKEELMIGRTLGAAVETGFHRAWAAIRDSNITTLIVCAILYWLGSSIVASAPVMGFALTLGIGVIASMLTAIVVTRTSLRLLIRSTLAQKSSLFTIYPRKPNV